MCAIVSAFFLLFRFLFINLTRPSQCVGLTPRGQDFESFIGAGKAKEIKGLFSNWINTVYRKLLPADHWR